MAVLPCLFVMMNGILLWHLSLNCFLESLLTLLDDSFQNSTEVRVALIHTLSLQSKVLV